MIDETAIAKIIARIAAGGMANYRTPQERAAYVEKFWGQWTGEAREICDAIREQLRQG